MNITFLYVLAYVITFSIICFFASIFFVNCGQCKDNKKTHIALIIGIICGTIINPFVVPVCAIVFLLVMFLQGGDK